MMIEEKKTQVNYQENKKKKIQMENSSNTVIRKMITREDILRRFMKNSTRRNTSKLKELY